MGRAYKTFADNALRREPVSIDSVAKDAFTNPTARTGWDTPSVAEGAEYTLVRWSLNYWLMVTLFRNHWIARKGVEIPAADACKAWPRLKCSLTPDQISQFNRTVTKLLIPQKIQRAITWARLYGGAGCLMVIDGHENRLDEPLDIDEVNPGTFKGLIADTYASQSRFGICCIWSRCKYTSCTEVLPDYGAAKPVAF
jgi:hypothetical protein